MGPRIVTSNLYTPSLRKPHLLAVDIVEGRVFVEGGMFHARGDGVPFRGVFKQRPLGAQQRRVARFVFMFITGMTMVVILHLAMATMMVMMVFMMMLPGGVMRFGAARPHPPYLAGFAGGECECLPIRRKRIDRAQNLQREPVQRIVRHENVG